MKRFWKYLGRTLLAIFLLLFLVVFLVYLPPVQHFLKKKAVGYVAEHYGLALDVGYFRLGFPADLVLEDVYCGTSSADTLVVVKALHLQVGLGRVFRKQLAVNDFTLKGAKFAISDDSAGMRLRADVGELNLLARQVNWQTREVVAEYVRLDEGKVCLVSGKETQPDTGRTTPLDWTFKVERIDLRQIDYQMNAETLPCLKAGLYRGSLVHGTVSLKNQAVDVDSVSLSGGNCELCLAASSPDKPERKTESGTVPALPWTIRAGSLQLDNSAFRMGNEREKTAELVLSGIGIRVDSVYNQGTIVKAQLKDLRAVQQDGVTVTAMQAGIGLDSADTWLEGGYLRTLNSWLRLEVHTNAGLQHLMEREPLAVRLTGQIGMADILPYYPDIPRQIRNGKIDVNTTLAISGKRIQIGQLILNMPGRFKLTGSGSLSAYRQPEKIRGSVVIRGEMPDITFAQGFLKDSAIVVPRHMDMLLKLKAERGTLDGLARICNGPGCLTLDATYQVKQQRYDGELTLNQFPLNHFLPADSLGTLSATARFSGQHFDWRRAKAEIFTHIRHFQYRNHDYQEITLNAAVDQMQLKGTLASEDPQAPMDLIFKGDSIGQEYTLSLSGRMGKVDVQALHFTEEPLVVQTDLDVRATLAEPENYTLKLHLDSLKMWDANKYYTLGDLTVAGESNAKETKLDLLSGDLQLHFRTDTALSVFIGNIGKVAGVVQQQIEERNVNMELLREDLPPFSLKITGAQDNAIIRFLKTRNIGFRQLMIDIASRKRNGIRVGIVANAAYFGTLRLDSVQLGTWQTGKSLMYSLSAGSSSEAWKGLFNINLTGRMQGDRFRTELRQKDIQGKIGFDLGINTVIGDSSMIVSLFPMNPILGYSRWIVNPGNQVVIGPHGKIRADLRMAYKDKQINIQSLEKEGEHDRLKVEIAGIDLNRLSQMVPFMPGLSGVLNTDLLLRSERNGMGVDGSVQVAELEYEKQRIGTVDLGLRYVAGNRFADHAVHFELKIDSIRRAIAEGAFSASGAGRAMKVDIDIPSFPLYVINAFVPDEVIKLSGELAGEMHLRGTWDTPLLNGNLAFHDGRAEVVMLGTVFRLDSVPIAIKDGRIAFRKYRFIAPNNSDMTLNGDIALTPFDRMNMNLSLDAGNFELVNVKKNETSFIYGKAYADIHVRLAGAFSDLKASGGANLLNRTDITYILRSSDPALVDKTADFVRFVSFRDSTLDEKDMLTNRVNPGSFVLRMLVEIGDQVKLGVDLSDDGSDHISIQGGGNLVLDMNPESGMTLSGKYILTGGSVIYNVPIVGKKEFNIRNGSFVEWTGNVMNPALNISASSQVKANVEDGEDTRQVVFEAIIRIQNTLNRPDITFDLSAPSDMVIQNQLATFSAEERTRQALNLLIYNTYTAPGAAKSNGSANIANNAIYSFVENELNKYTRKAGLTVGFDSHNTEENVTRTDVTYQFSRQLFNDRVRVKIGGRISTDNNEGQGGNNLQDNLVDDISIEYVLTKKRNLYVKVFRHSNYESVLDGEVTQTGAGIVWRKNFRKFKDLFKNKNREERRAQKLEEKDSEKQEENEK